MKIKRPKGHWECDLSIFFQLAQISNFNLFELSQNFFSVRISIINIPLGYEQCLLKVNILTSYSRFEHPMQRTIKKLLTTKNRFDAVSSSIPAAEQNRKTLKYYSKNWPIQIKIKRTNLNGEA